MIVTMPRSSSSNIAFLQRFLRQQQPQQSMQRCYHGTSVSLLEEKQTVLVLGSSGALGSVVARHLGKDRGMNVIGADIVERTHGKGWHPDAFVTLPYSGGLGELTKKLTTGVGRILEEDGELDAIVCASGGWQGDPRPPAPNASVEDTETGAVEYANLVESMLRVNLYPVVAAGYAADRFMGNQGLFLVMGASAALSPTPGMVGYGLSKTAAHQFVQTLGATTGKAVVPKKKRKEGRRARIHGEYLDSLTAMAILPTTIDTPANRKANPKGRFDKWTKPMEIAKEIGNYIEHPALRPHSGSLVKVVSKSGNQEDGSSGTEFHLAR